MAGGLPRSWLGMNSCTVPVTQTSLPTAAAAGGAEEVNTNTPSEVIGSPSPGAAIWMKKPFDFTPVTMPLVVTMLRASGEASALPWICAIVLVALHTSAGSTVSWNSFCATSAPLSVTCIVNVKGEPVVVEGVPLSVASVSVRPGGGVPATIENV